MSQPQPKCDFTMCIGTITSVNGIKGYVKIRSFADKPHDFSLFKHIFDINGKQYKINIITSKGDSILAAVEGISSRDEAEALINTQLFIKRSELSELSQDQYYYAELLGITAQLSDGKQVGVVKNVLNFGAGDILEIYDIASKDTFYYPFTKQAVTQVNLEKNYIVLSQL